jgi:hypothetical protein
MFNDGAEVGYGPGIIGVAIIVLIGIGCLIRFVVEVIRSRMGPPN